jgi:tetratricopeptide (TPR) repeat protein
MKPADNIEKLIKRFCVKEKLCVRAGDEMDKRILDDVLAAYEKSRKKPQALTGPNIWRKIMKSGITKLAAVVVILVALVLTITFFDKSVAPAYALGQTIEANRTMRYLHTKWFYASHEDVSKECWLEFDETGRPRNVRINWAEWIADENVVVWNQEKTQMLSKKGKRLTVFNDEIYTSRIQNMTETDDLRLLVEKMYDRQTKGEVKIEIDQPADKSKPVIVTSTNLQTQRRSVLFVDQSTKLVTSAELYQFKNGQYEYEGVMEYHDYNVPIDEKMFNLDDEIPEDVRRIDTRTEDIGIAQENLTDKEVAVKVVRQHFEALIAKDYTKAGQIGGLLLSPAEIQRVWGRLNVVRVVSIGEPVPNPKPSKVFPEALCVPCTIEVERNGQTGRQLLECRVKTVLGKRQNWMLECTVSKLPEFDKRMEKDREIYTEAQILEMMQLSQVADENWNTQEAKESLKKLISKYTQGNLVGCAMLYLGQMSTGREREDYLKTAVEKYSDCWYGDGVQVGAFARCELAFYYHEIGQVEQASSLFNELVEKYPDAIDHNGCLLVDKIPEQYKPEETEE